MQGSKSTGKLEVACSHGGCLRHRPVCPIVPSIQRKMGGQPADTPSCVFVFVQVTVLFLLDALAVPRVLVCAVF